MKYVFAIFGLLAFSAPAADEADPPSLSAADQAYRDGDSETGNRILKALIDHSKGNYQIAVDCLGRILSKADRLNPADPWLRYAAGRLLALQRIGAVSANSRAVRDAANIEIELRLKEGRLFEVAEMVDELALQNPHDLHWKMLRARILRRLESPETRNLYRELREEMDLDHPHAITRERWHAMADELKADPKSLPRPIDPIPFGSPMILMDPDDPDGRWREFAERAPADIAEKIDRLISLSLIGQMVVPWEDMSGLTDPPRAIDLHLLSKPAEQLEALRKAQEESFSLERIPENLSEAEILALSRRYPWIAETHKMLLGQANRMLWAGRSHAALRGFHEILSHSIDRETRDEALVGSWIALSQLGETELLSKETEAAEIAGQSLPWMGKTASAVEIRSHLLPGKTVPSDSKARPLDELELISLQIPPISPWASSSHGTGTALDFQFEEGRLLVSGRNLLAMFSTHPFSQKPEWLLSHRFPADGQIRENLRTGYFRPTFTGSQILTRWGFKSAPDGIAAFETKTGKPLWKNEAAENRASENRRPGFNFPLGDPVAADGLLFFLQWSTVNDINHNRGRRLNLVCFDPGRQRNVWSYTIAESGLSSDIAAALEKAPSDWAIYGNRVRVHRGAVYSNSNSGMISRSDIRDGRTDWVHFYRRGQHGNRSENLGAAPLIAGDLLICMPRDSGRIFALDQHTGRLVWENNLVLPEEMVGIIGESLVLRGKGNLVALDVSNGEALWLTPIRGDVIGRTQHLGDSVYVATRSAMWQIDAEDGAIRTNRRWDLGGGRPLTCAIGGDGIYVVTDQPADDPQNRLGEALNPEAPDSAAPVSSTLTRAWSLPRTNATLAVPPAGSPLEGIGFLQSGGILEGIDLTARGGIRWRRFTNSKDPGLIFAGEKILLATQGAGSNATTGDRLTAFRGTDGQFLWESQIPTGLHHIAASGEMCVFHDARGTIFAIDSATGERGWERNLGRGHLMQLAVDGGRIDVFSSSFERAARHLVIDIQSGATVAEHEVLVDSVPGGGTNGRAIEDGYFEVSFPPTKTRYIRLTTLSEINGREWASAAELHVVGEDRRNVSRKDWNITVDSFEPNSRMTTVPENLIDGDRDSWWHSQWLDGIPKHPHTISIDLGSEQVVKGLRYLPAVIINNNGMIKDYELAASADGENWGDPIAKGIMVNRLRVNKAMVAGRTLFFEAINSQTGKHGLCRYRFDGKAADVVLEDGRLERVAGRYLLATAGHHGGSPHLVVLDGDDPAYQFNVGTLREDLAGVRFDGPIVESEKLVMAAGRIAIADLKGKTLTHKPDDQNLPKNKNGIVVTADDDVVAKFVHQGNSEHSLTIIDTKAGTVSEAVLTDPNEPFQPIRRGRYQGDNPITSFGRVILLNDSANITAWISTPDTVLSTP